VTAADAGSEMTGAPSILADVECDKRAEYSDPTDVKEKSAN
jgi:hypothetical protein